MEIDKVKKLKLTLMVMNKMDTGKMIKNKEL